MGRIVITVGFMVGVGMLAACGTEDRPTVDGQSVQRSVDRETNETETPSQERVGLLDGGDCVVSASRRRELEDRLGSVERDEDAFQNRLALWSPDGNRPPSFHASRNCAP
jgi:hypothetical protein